MNVLINMGACALGYGLGHWVRPRDFWSSFWGIGVMISVAFALTQQNLWYLLGILLFGLFLLRRRNNPK